MDFGISYARVLADVTAGQNVVADSRAVERGCVFVAVRGAAEDGTRYVGEALERGAATIVLDASKRNEGHPGDGHLDDGQFDEGQLDDGHLDGGLLAAINDRGAKVALVADTRHAVSELAAAHYATAGTPLTILAVTGTNGKTTCAYLLEHLFSALGEKVGVLGTVSYRWPGFSMPAPLTTPGPVEVHRALRDMASAGATMCVMEVSSHALSQGRVAHVPFAGACFTNLTQDHLDFHADMEDYFRAKARLFTSTPRGNKAMAVNADDPYGLRIADLCPGAWTYGFEGRGPAPERHVAAELLEHGTGGVGIRVTAKNGVRELHSPLIGRFNADNLLCVLTLGLALGIEDFTPLQTFRGVPGRLERVENARGLHVFVDYAHTPDALVNVQQALRGAGFKRLITVFGCGGNRDRAKRPLMGEAVARFSDVAVLTSDNPRFEEPLDIMRDVEPGLKNARKVLSEPDRRRATEMAIDLLGPDDALLIAGKGHEDYQIVKGVKRHYSDQETVRELLG